MTDPALLTLFRGRSRRGGNAEHLGVGGRLRTQTLPAGSSPQQRSSLGERVGAAFAGVLLVVELDHEGRAGAAGGSGAAHCDASSTSVSASRCRSSREAVRRFQALLQGVAAAGKAQTQPVFGIALGAILMLAACWRAGERREVSKVPPAGGKDQSLVYRNPEATIRLNTCNSH